MIDDDIPLKQQDHGNGNGDRLFHQWDVKKCTVLFAFSKQ